MRVYTEQSTGYVSATFLDKDNAAQAPAQVQYRIDCLTSGEVVRDWTTVPPAGTVEIVLTPADNAMRNSANRNEHRRMTVAATYNETDEVRGTCEFYVRNLDHVN